MKLSRRTWFGSITAIALAPFVKPAPLMTPREGTIGVIDRATFSFCRYQQTVTPGVSEQFDWLAFKMKQWQDEQSRVLLREIYLDGKGRT